MWALLELEYTSLSHAVSNLAMYETRLGYAHSDGILAQEFVTVSRLPVSQASEASSTLSLRVTNAEDVDHAPRPSVTNEAPVSSATAPAASPTAMQLLGLLPPPPPPSSL